MRVKNAHNSLAAAVLVIAMAVMVATLLYARDRQKQRELRLRQYQMQNNLPHEWGTRIRNGQMGFPGIEDAVVL